MNMEAHNPDCLRNLIRKLQTENRRLKDQLKAANIAFDTEDVFDEKPENMEEYSIIWGESEGVPAERGESAAGVSGVSECAGGG